MRWRCLTWTTDWKMITLFCYLHNFYTRTKIWKIRLKLRVARLGWPQKVISPSIVSSYKRTVRTQIPVLAKDSFMSIQLSQITHILRPLSGHTYTQYGPTLVTYEDEGTLGWNTQETRNTRALTVSSLCSPDRKSRWKQKLSQKRLSVLCSNEQSTQEDGLIIEPTRSNKNWHGLVNIA